MDTKKLDNMHTCFLTTINDVLEREYAKNDNRILCLNFLEKEIIKKLSKLNDDEFIYVCSGNMDTRGTNIMLLSVKSEFLYLTKYILNRCKSNERLKGLPNIDIFFGVSVVALLEKKPAFCQKILLADYYMEHCESKINPEFLSEK